MKRSMRRRPLRPSLVVCLLLSSAAARAQTGPGTELMSARARGRAGASRALGYDDSAVALTPAALSQIPKVDFEVGYFRDTEPTAYGNNDYGIEIMLGDSLTGAQPGRASRATG